MTDENVKIEGWKKMGGNATLHRGNDAQSPLVASGIPANLRETIKKGISSGYSAEP